MGIIMLNGVKYGGSGLGGEYERKPITLYDGELSSGSVRYKLNPYLDYSYNGLRVPVSAYDVTNHEYTGYADAHIFRVRLTGHCIRRSFCQDCCLSVLTQRAWELSYCGMSKYLPVCDSVIDHEIQVYPIDFRNETVTSNGYIGVSLYSAMCENDPELEVSMEYPNNLKLLRIELL